MADLRLRVKVVITNRRAAAAFYEAIQRLRDVAEYQSWNSDLTEICDLLAVAERGLCGVSDGNGRGGGHADQRGHDGA